MKPVLSSKSKFRLLRAFLACTGFALWSATSAACQEAVTAEHLRKAAALFKSSCSSCHLPPDPQLRTDRAWLNQVLDTA